MIELRWLSYYYHIIIKFNIPIIMIIIKTLFLLSWSARAPHLDTNDLHEKATSLASRFQMRSISLDQPSAHVYQGKHH